MQPGRLLPADGSEQKHRSPQRLRLRLQPAVRRTGQPRPR
jgi:hypothetical protein